MFFKKIKNKFIFLFLLLIIPLNVFAYSEYIIAGGENIGLQINSKNVIIVGFYEVNGKYPAKEANLQIGDRILKINDIKISSIEEMVKTIKNNDQNKYIDIEYQRENNILKTKLPLEKSDEEVIKSGLYVKDSITGIGTLTFIDPNTKLYGALGHEILEKTTGEKFEIKNGKIYNSTVTNIKKSNNGSPGEKNARYNSNDTYGNIKENTSSGVFGEYTKEIPNKKLYKVGKYENINLGEAKIMTVLKDEKVEEFNIKIINLSEKNKRNKNILFEIIDESLLSVTGGIVQGMSGSPIIQNDYIIGAVTHVVVDNPIKGYGIFITNMLEEGEN